MAGTKNACTLCMSTYDYALLNLHDNGISHNLVSHVGIYNRSANISLNLQHVHLTNLLL